MATKATSRTRSTTIAESAAPAIQTSDAELIMTNLQGVSQPEGSSTSWSLMCEETEDSAEQRLKNLVTNKVPPVDIAYATIMNNLGKTNRSRWIPLSHMKFGSYRDIRKDGVQQLEEHIINCSGEVKNFTSGLVIKETLLVTKSKEALQFECIDGNHRLQLLLKQ